MISNKFKATNIKTATITTSSNKASIHRVPRRRMQRFKAAVANPETGEANVSEIVKAIKDSIIVDKNLNLLYNKTIAYIGIILKRKYKMNDIDIKEAIQAFKLKELFKQDAKMVAHTSHEDWAKDIYEYWKNITDK